MLVHAELDKSGRLLIPSAIRKQLGYKKGSKFVLRSINDELHIMSLNKVLEKAQTLLQNDSQHSAVDDFLQMRREEYNQENS